MKQIFSLSEIPDIPLTIEAPCIIFLRGDLWVGKTTLSQYILSQIGKIDEAITSPTYTYYNKYKQHYHFDLYRLEKYDEFFAIGWEEILDNNTGIILIEWPELLAPYYSPDIDIKLENTSDWEKRSIEIIKINK